MKKGSDASKRGICALTGMEGAFVTSHLIPKALTRLSSHGERYIETSTEQWMGKRYDSWFDTQLVTRSGEDILSEIDDSAIKILRSKKLIWAGWETDDLKQELHFEDAGLTAIRLAELPSQPLQLFFLSLLWRAAASLRPEFELVKLSTTELQDLRERVRRKDPGKLDDYPIQLFQLVTKGAPHNRTPLLESKPVITMSGDLHGIVRYARFYFDGLVSHIHLPGELEFPAEYLSTCLGLGPDGQTLIFGQGFAESRTADNLRTALRAADKKTPDHIKKRLVP